MIVIVTTKGKGIRKTRHKGIVAAAKKLDITREHLYRVITGRVVSPKLEAWARRNVREEMAS